jgi:hypothetical protein
MIELIAAGAGVVLAAPAVNDWCLDGRVTGRTLTALVRLLGRKVTVVEPVGGELPQDEIDRWLQDNAGTTDVSAEDRAFFAEQLELARQEVQR